MRRFLERHKLILDYICKCVEIAALAIAIGALGADIEARNSQYKPQIEVETVQEEQVIAFNWNTNEKSKDVDFDTVSLKLTNIGNGNANNVTIEFDSVVLDEWIAKLKELNPKEDYEYLDNYNNDKMKKSFPYMLKDKENFYMVDVPEVYFDCLNEIHKQKSISGKQEIELTSIKINVSCYDIQDNPLDYVYEISYLPSAKTTEMTSNTGNQGISYVFEIIDTGDKFEINVVDILNCFFRIISILSLVAALIGSVKYVREEKKIKVYLNENVKIESICDTDEKVNCNAKEKVTCKVVEDDNTKI